MDEAIYLKMLERVEESRKNMTRLKEEWPEQRTAFEQLMGSTMKEGKIPIKYKYLIAVALSVMTGCPWCIALNVNRAIQNGATKEEIMEASWIAVYVGAGEKIHNIQYVMQALEEML